MGRTRKRRGCSLFLVGSLFFFSPWVWAQQVGEADGIEGTAEFLRTAATQWTPLAMRGGVLLLDQIRTQPSSKLEVLLGVGSKFALAERVEVSIPERSGDRIVLLLNGGTLRVVTAPPPGATTVTRTPAGQVVAKNTGYIVSCGPPVTAAPDSCRFVGLYGTTRIESLSGVTVELRPGFYTDVRGSQRPSVPQLLPPADLQNLIDATTIVGTGAPEDRLAITEKVEPAPIKLPPVEPPPPDNLKPPWVDQPNQPIPPFKFKLPLPPPPPSF